MQGQSSGHAISSYVDGQRGWGWVGEGIASAGRRQTNDRLCVDMVWLSFSLTHSPNGSNCYRMIDASHIATSPCHWCVWIGRSVPADSIPMKQVFLEGQWMVILS